MKEICTWKCATRWTGIGFLSDHTTRNERDEAPVKPVEDSLVANAGEETNGARKVVEEAEDIIDIESTEEADDVDSGDGDTATATFEEHCSQQEYSSQPESSFPREDTQASNLKTDTNEVSAGIDESRQSVWKRHIPPKMEEL